MNHSITYLDNNATTRVDDAVAQAMLGVLTEEYGNPSSLHRFGAQVAARIEEARGSVARLIGARETEIVFTSGGTEADNAALRGVLAARPSRRHIVVSQVEHSAVLEMAEQLEREGVQVSYVGVTRSGVLDLDELAAAIRDDTAIVSAMYANNETGVIMPLEQVVRIAHELGALVHTDAVQAVGKIDVDVSALKVDLLSLSAHKIHGPKGVGAMYIRSGTPFRSSMIGGPQERGRRGGTQNAPGIIGLAVACELLLRRDPEEKARVQALRDEFEREVAARFPQAVIAGKDAPRVYNTSCVCFPGVEAEAVLLLLSEAGVCASSGAACSSGSLEPSHVMSAMKMDPYLAQGQIRFSFGKYNTPADLQRVLDVLPGVIERVGSLNVAG